MNLPVFSLAQALPFLRRQCRLAVVVATTCLPASAVAQDEAPGISISETESGYVIKVAEGEARAKVSLYDFACAAAAASGQVLVWDQRTNGLLHARRVGFVGEKTVSAARFSSFLKVTMIVGDFVCVELGEGDSPVLLSLPVIGGPAAATPVATDSVVQLDGEHFTIDFGKGEAGESITLYDFTQACANVTGMQFTWSSATEKMLKKQRVRLVGKKTVPKETFESFFKVLMTVSDMLCTEVSDGDVTVFLVEPMRATDTAAAPVASEDELAMTFGGEGGTAEELSCFELLQRMQASAGFQFTWSQDTEPRLKAARVWLAGKASIPKEEAFSLLSDSMSAMGFTCQRVGPAELSVVKIDVR